MKTKYCSLFIALTSLIIFSTISYAKIDTVLQVIPTGSVGWVRVNNLADLNEKIDGVMQKFAPPGEDIPGGTILEAFSQLLPIPAVNSVSELGELGFDTHGDLSVFWMDASLQKPLIAVHVRDKAEAEAVLQRRGRFVDAEYQDIAYKRSDAAAFVILDNILVYAKSEADVRKCVETYLKTNQSLLEDPNYVSVNARWGSDANDLTGYVALGKVAEIYLPMIRMFSGRANSNALDPTAQAGVWLLEQAESLAISVALDAQGAKMDHLLGFRDDSPIRSFLTSKPQSLELFYSLPKDIFMVGGMTMDAETMEHMMMAFADILSETDPNIPETAIAEAQNYIRSMKDFAASLGTEAAFGVQIGSGFVPNMILLYQLTDEETARGYMEDYEHRLNETVEIYRKMGLNDLVDQLSQIKPGPEETYEGVQIQSIQLTDKLPLSIPGMPSQQQSLSLWYAFQSGKLIMGFGPDPAFVKGTLDVLAGRADGINSARNFETVHEGLPSESNLSFYFALIDYVKRQPRMGMSISPDVLDEVKSGVMFGFSAAIQDEDIVSRLYVSVDEVRQFITAIFTLSQTAQVSQTAQASDPYSQMRKYREQGELDKMLEYAEERMKNYPRRAEMMQSELVRGYQEHDRLNELISHFQEKLKSEPTDVNAYKLLGRAFQRNRELVKAMEMYEKAAVLAPDDANVQSSLGSMYLQQRANEKAITAYKKAIQLQPAGSYLYPQLARAYQRDGQADEIAQLAESLRPHLRRQGFNYAHLGDVYLAGNLYDEAIEAYKKAIELEPRNERYFKDKLARTYEQAGKPELAAELRKSIRRPEASRPVQTDLVGQPAPDFALRNLDGKEVKLADLKGKVVILDFWATWCGPCVKEIPHFIQLYKQYQGQGFEMVGISTDRNGVGVVKSFVQQHKINYPILMADGKVQQAYGEIRAIPTTFVIDKMGVIQRQYIGYRDKAVFEADIKAALADTLGVLPSEPPSSRSAVARRRQRPREVKPVVRPIPTEIAVDPAEIARQEVKAEVVVRNRNFTPVPAIPGSASLEQESGEIATPTSGLLKGKVADTQTPRPNNIRAATVTVKNSFSPPRTTKTDAAGNYEIPRLPPGEYIVRVSKSGYDDSTEYAMVRSGGEAFHDVRLYKTGESPEVRQFAASKFLKPQVVEGAKQRGKEIKPIVRHTIPMELPVPIQHIVLMPRITTAVAIRPHVVRVRVLPPMQRLSGEATPEGKIDEQYQLASLLGEQAGKVAESGSPDPKLSREAAEEYRKVYELARPLMEASDETRLLAAASLYNASYLLYGLGEYEDYRKVVKYFGYFIRDFQDHENYHAVLEYIGLASFEAARLKADLDQFASTAEYFLRFAREFPNSDDAAVPQFQAGEAYFAVGGGRSGKANNATDPNQQAKESSLAVDAYRKAVSAYRGVVDRFSDSEYAPGALNVIAACHMYLSELVDPSDKQKELESMSAAYKELAEKYPQSEYAARAFLSIGNDYYNQASQTSVSLEDRARFYGRSLENYRKALKVPGIKTRTRMAVEGYIKETEELFARDIYSIGIALIPLSNANAGMQQARKNAPKAIPYFREIIEKLPGTSYADLSYIQLGVCYEYLENWEESEKSYAGLIKKYTDENGNPTAPFSQNVLQAVTFARRRKGDIMAYRLSIKAKQ